MVRVLLAVFVAVLPGCDHGVTPPHDASPTARAAGPKQNALSRAAILPNIPTNSNQRCVGISVVAEALLDGIEIGGEDSEEVENVAQRIYDGLTEGQALRYHRHVVIEGARVAINSETALDKLGTLVADCYKRDFMRLMKTEHGRRKLLSAQDSVIATSSELDRILDADPDKTDVFFGTGTRMFPDGRLEDTDHAFLIGKQSSGDIVVHDANDPGTPIACHVINTEEGVVVEWTCRYRGTGDITTQSYFVVDKDTAFRAMLGE